MLKIARYYLDSYDSYIIYLLKKYLKYNIYFYDIGAIKYYNIL